MTLRIQSCPGFRRLSAACRLLLPLLLLLLLGGARVAQAQPAARRLIEGTVKDARTGEAVCGAALTTGDARRWAISDAEGRFRLAGIDEPEVDLHVSCLGYVTQTLHLRTETPRSTVDIALRESNLAIDEVVVTAQRRSAESGSAYAIDRQTL